MDLPDPGRYFDEHGSPIDEFTPAWVTDEGDAIRWDYCLGIAALHGGLDSVENANQDLTAQAFARVLFDSDMPVDPPDPDLPDANSTDPEDDAPADDSSA